MKNQPSFVEQLMTGRLSEAVSSPRGLRLLRCLSSAACARLGLPADEVEDLAQDVVCRLLETEARAAGLQAKTAGEATSTIDSPAAEGDSGVVQRKGGRLLYLRQVTRNLAVDQVRRRATAKRATGIRPEAGSGDPLDCVEWLADRSPGPEDRLLARERRRQFLRLCDRHLRSRRLRRRDLEIVRLAWLDGLSSREIAREIRGALEAASIDSLLHRLRRRMGAAGILVRSRRCMA
jgi:DNA-directed RNA polymerase specialized sigma24 family protein